MKEMVIMAKKIKIRLKKSVQKKLIIASLLIVIIIIASVSIKKYIAKKNYESTTEYKLLQLGYTQENIQNLNSKLDKDYVNGLVDAKKNDNLLKIIVEKYYLSKNIDAYLEYLSKNKSVEPGMVVALVNVNAAKGWYGSIVDADTSNQILAMVNKNSYLNEDYVPENLVDVSNLYAYADHKLVKDANDAYTRLWEDAKTAGYTFILSGSYRSYASQKSTYENYEHINGRIKADASVARAGHSDHQTGLGLDIIEYGKTGNDLVASEAYTWLLNNASKYGFIQRYPEGKENLTGFNFEAWHFRYVGTDYATKIKNENITFDEYYAYYIQK